MLINSVINSVFASLFQQYSGSVSPVLKEVHVVVHDNVIYGIHGIPYIC